MKIHRRLDQDEFRTILQNSECHHQYYTLCFAFAKPYRYRASIDETDLTKIWMNSSAEDPHPLENRFYILATTINQIKNNIKFLEQENPLGLNGVWIREVLADLVSGKRQIGSTPPYILDIDPIDGDKGPYIIDGMHTLVAYGLWANHTFPIPILYFTSQEEIIGQVGTH